MVIISVVFLRAAIIPFTTTKVSSGLTVSTERSIKAAFYNAIQLNKPFVEIELSKKHSYVLAAAVTQTGLHGERRVTAICGRAHSSTTLDCIWVTNEV